MKQKSLPKFLALTICLELIISPLAMAQQTAMQLGLGVLQTGVGVYNNLKGGQQGANNYLQADQQGFQLQQTPAADKYFTQQNLQKIPGLNEYIAKRNMDASKTGGKLINPAALNCQTLPTTLFEANTEICRNKTISAMSSENQQKAQADEAFYYYNQYLQIDKLYANYSTRSNVGGQPFGVGCMEDSMEILKGFFAYRLEQMDTMVTEIEAAEARFEQASEMDLKAIRESTAILGGEGSKFAAEFKNSNVFDYGERFGDAACNSIMAKNEIDAQGKGEGLLGIEKRLKETYSTVPEGSKYSPESYIKNNAAIVEDIQKMATKVSTQATLNFGQIASGQEGYSSFLSSLSSSVSSDTGVSVALNSAFFSDVQTKFTQTRNSLNNQMGVLSNELGAKGGNALSLISNIDNDSNFEAQVRSLENSIKNECLQKSGLDTALSRIHEPTLSKQASKHSSEELIPRLKAILEDPNLSPESKISQLNAINSSGGSRFQVRLDSDFETKVIQADGTVGTKKAIAASTITPASFFTNLIQNCDTQFQVNKLGNQLSGKEAVKQLRTLKEEYKKAAKQNAEDMKKEITKKMIDCNGNAEVASSTNVGSCSPASLNMTNPSFCTKAAFSCSSNMKSCSEKANKIVKDLKDDRLKRTNNYNNNVELNRKQLVGMFDSALSKYMKEAESLRGMFGAGFSSPKDIQRDIKDGSQFDSRFSQNGVDSLEIKDPKKYMEMIKTNVASLRKSVEDQQKQIIGNDGNLQKHIDQTKENYKTQVLAKASKLANDCLAAYNSYNKMVSQRKEAYDKIQGEIGEKVPTFCKKFNEARDGHPNGACSGNVGDLTKAAFKAASQSGDRNASNAVAEFETMCDGYNNSKDSDDKLSVTKMCAKLSKDGKDNSCSLWKLAFAQSETLDPEEGENCKIVTKKKTKDDKGNEVKTEDVTQDCAKAMANYETKINKVYTELYADSPDIKVSINSSAPAFCNAGDNTGAYRTKDAAGGAVNNFLSGFQAGQQ